MDRMGCAIWSYCCGESVIWSQYASGWGCFTQVWKRVESLPTIWSSSLYGRCAWYISLNFSIQNLASSISALLRVTPLVKVSHCISKEVNILAKNGKSTPAWAEAVGIIVLRCGGASPRVSHWSVPPVQPPHMVTSPQHHSRTASNP